MDCYENVHIILFINVARHFLGAMIDRVFNNRICVIARNVINESMRPVIMGADDDIMDTLYTGILQ